MVPGVPFDQDPSRPLFFLSFSMSGGLNTHPQSSPGSDSQCSVREASEQQQQKQRKKRDDFLLVGRDPCPLSPLYYI